MKAKLHVCLHVQREENNSLQYRYGLYFVVRVKYRVSRHML